MIRTYVKKPLKIEAIQYTGHNLDDLRKFVPEECRNNKIHQPLGIHTLEGVMEIKEGDYIIKGVLGEFYVCNPDVFALSYEEVLRTDVPSEEKIGEDNED